MNYFHLCKTLTSLSSDFFHLSLVIKESQWCFIRDPYLWELSVPHLLSLLRLTRFFPSALLPDIPCPFAGISDNRGVVPRGWRRRLEDLKEGKFSRRLPRILHILGSTRCFQEKLVFYHFRCHVFQLSYEQWDCNSSFTFVPKPWIPICNISFRYLMNVLCYL